MQKLAKGFLKGLDLEDPINTKPNERGRKKSKNLPFLQNWYFTKLSNPHLVKYIHTIPPLHPKITFNVIIFFYFCTRNISRNKLFDITLQSSYSAFYFCFVSIPFSFRSAFLKYFIKRVNRKILANFLHSLKF